MEIDEKGVTIAFNKTNDRLAKGDMSGGMYQMIADYEAAKQETEQPDELSDEQLERKLQKVIFGQYLVGNGSDLTTQAVLGFICQYFRKPLRESSEIDDLKKRLEIIADRPSKFAQAMMAIFSPKEIAEANFAEILVDVFGACDLSKPLSKIEGGQS